MKLRTQTSLLLFMFGLVPLVMSYVINMPMIFDRIELLYHKAHIQNLRAGFSDLDQHIARRHEMVRLLAKMPEKVRCITSCAWNRNVRQFVCADAQGQIRFWE